MLLAAVTQGLQERVAVPAAVQCGDACLQTTFFVLGFPGLLNSHIN